MIMSVWFWIPVILAVWLVTGLAVGLALGPVLRRNAERYPLAERKDSAQDE
jgi:hypothetical protein